MNVMRWADDHVNRYGDYPAALIAGHETWSNGTVYESSARFAKGLIDIGVMPGDRVVLWLPNGLEAVVAFSAVIRAGAVAVVLSGASPAREVARVLEHCSAGALITSAELRGSANGSFARASKVIIAGDRRALEGDYAFDELIEHSSSLTAPVSRSSNDIAQIVYTSGTTGDAKGVAWTHGVVDARYRAFADTRNPSFPARRSLCALPLAASFGAQYLYLRLLQKMSLLLLARFAPEPALLALQRHEIEGAMLVPAMCEAMLAVPNPERYNLSHLKSVLVGGSAVSTSLVQRFKQVFGVRLAVVYGLTELGPVTRTVPGETGGAVGKVRQGLEVRVVDEDRRPLAAGEVGEIEIAAGKMQGRYYDPSGDHGVASGKGDDWFRTGDLGYVDTAGELSIVGRCKEIIIQGGVNVYPRALVEVILELSGVSECAVVGVPDSYLGEQVVACVVRDAGSGLDADAVLAHCRARVDAKQLPARVQFFERLPKNELGKIRIAALKAAVEQIDERAAETPLWRDLQAATGNAARRALLEKTLQTRVRAILGSAADVDCSRPFRELGVDSIGAVQLANSLSAQLGRRISPTLTFNQPTVGAVCDFLETEFFPTLSAEPAASAPTPTRRAVVETRQHIAIIGAACRLPGGADDPEKLWALLLAGTDATSEIDRWDFGDLYDPRPGTPGRSYTKRAALLRDADKFDASFFGLNDDEAARLDPQHRLSLEVSWHAIEDAGYDPRGLSRYQTGVFLGITSSSYDGGDAIGSLPAMGPARIAHFLDLHGPALAIDTTCSSSLIAIDLAVARLRAAQCDLALAGGVSVIGSPRSFVGLSRIHALAADGRCKAFDEQADGFGRGEGCVIFLLKRLVEAEKDGDRILAVIRGCASNHDGRSTSLTAPNGRAQEAVIRAALSDAGIAPDELDYLEAHGTGTQLGDPIEMEAAMRVLGRRRAPLTIGSIKTNVGHLEAAAGAAGVLKGIMMLQAGVIPPNLHFHKLNPLLAPHASDFVIPSRPCSFAARPGERRTVGVTSMGMSGTNAHVVLEEAPVRSRAPATGDLCILCLSALTLESLDDLVGAYVKRLSEVSNEVLADICYTASVGRFHFDKRVAVIGATASELAQRLREAQRRRAGDFVGRKPGSLAFLFGHGDPTDCVDRSLYERQPAFKDAVDACVELTRAHVPFSSAEALFAPQTLDVDARSAGVARFVAGYALVQLWASLGIRPEVAWAHGHGEHLAAVVAGVFTLEEALHHLLQQDAAGSPAVDISGRAPRRAGKDPTLPLISAAAMVARHGTDGPRSESESGEAALEPACSALAASGARIFLPVGMDRATFEKIQSGTRQAASASWLDAWYGLGDANARFLQTLADLYVAGVDPAWSALHRGSPCVRVALPLYSFQRKRYWAEGAGHARHARAPKRPESRPGSAILSPTNGSGLALGEEVHRAELARLVARCIGASSPPGDTENLGDLGIDSLRLMDLLATLNRRFGVRVTPSQFNAAPTIAGLANCISVAGLPDGNARAANEPHPQLIVVRDGNDEPPLVCLHPAGGAVTAYMTLRTALSGNRPILAIQSRATADAGAEFGTIDEMARCYSELLLGVRGGTVSLFGWSLGGVLAHAVGAVLEDRGLRVEQVGMVDPPEPGAAISRRIDDLAVTAIVYDNTPNPPAPEVWAEAVRTIVASGRPERMLAECEARGFLPAGLLSSTEFQNARALYTAHAQLIVDYVPQRTILAPLSIWWAVSRPGSRWARYTAGRFKDRVVGGSHYTIMKPPFLQSILSEFESQRDLFSRLCVEKGTN